MACFFLVHPINIETVAYISDFQDVLFTFFGLLALVSLTYIRRPFIAILSSIVFLAASLLSKETGIVFIAIASSYLWFFKRKWLIYYLLIVVFLLIGYFVMRCQIAHVCVALKSVSPIMQLPLTARLLHIPKIILTYSATFLFPYHLTVAQHWIIHKPDVFTFYIPLLIDMIIIGLLVMGFVLVRKTSSNRRAYLFLCSWFMISFLFHLQIIPLDFTVAERWFYVPSIGLLGMICIVVSNLKHLRNVIIIASILISVLGIRTLVRAQEWSNGLILFSHDGTRSTNAFDLENNWGVELFRVGRYNEALQHFARSTTLAPGSSINWLNFGIMYERRGDYDKALQCYRRATQNGEYYLAYENYVALLMKLKQYHEAQQFLEQKALKSFPHDTELINTYKSLTIQSHEKP
jgi:hypothetical protein